MNVPTMTELVYWCAMESSVAAEALLEHHGVRRREARQIVEEARECDFTANGLQVIEQALTSRRIHAGPL